jgi:phage terminase large subunit GpA-like protein
MYSVGSFTGKEVLMSRLSKVTEPGPGYIHLPDDIDPQHLDQFLNERIVTRFVKGRPVRAWVRSGPNEQIDLFVYALAACTRWAPMSSGDSASSSGLSRRRQKRDRRPRRRHP